MRWMPSMNNDLPLPDRLLLMSPAIGVAPYAMFAAWHKTLSWLTYFEKFQWQAVLPEYDPYQVQLLSKKRRSRNLCADATGAGKTEPLRHTAN